MKNILFISTNLTIKNQFGGQELYIMKFMNRLNQLNYNTIILSPVNFNNHKTIIIPKSKFSFFKSLKLLNKTILNNNIDTIISNDFYSNILTYFAKNTKNIKLYAFIHDLYTHLSMNSFLFIRKSIYQIIDNILLNKFDNILFCSEYLYKKYLTKKNILLKPLIDTTKKLKKTQNKKINIGWVGNNDIKKKGFDIFSKISNKLNTKKYNFYAAGIIPNKKLKNSNNNINFEGYYNNITDFFNFIDVLILPYRYEGLGLILLESIKYNIPTIASSIPSFKLISKKNKNNKIILINNKSFTTNMLEKKINKILDKKADL